MLLWGYLMHSQDNIVNKNIGQITKAELQEKGIAKEGGLIGIFFFTGTIPIIKFLHAARKSSNMTLFNLKVGLIITRATSKFFTVATLISGR